MTALLLLAMLQVPQDTIRTEFVIPLPRQEQVRDTTPIIVNVDVPLPDSVLRAIYVAGAADARERAMADCACMDSGPPDWFWGGILVLGAAAIYVWHQKDADDPDAVFNVEGGQGGAGGAGGAGGDGGAGGSSHGHGHPPKNRPPDNRPPDKPGRPHG